MVPTQNCGRAAHGYAQVSAADARVRKVHRETKHVGAGGCKEAGAAHNLVGVVARAHDAQPDLALLLDAHLQRAERKHASVSESTSAEENGQCVACACSSAGAGGARARAISSADT